MKASKPTICCKCKTAPATVLVRHAYYCQSCFLFVFVGKYRSILSKSRSIARNRGKVLLACSGGPSSIAMLNLTNEFTRVAPHEKKKIQLLSSVMVCHIDESALFQEQSGTVQHLESMMKEQYPNMEFKHHRMEDIFKDEFMGTSDFDQVLKCVDDANKKDNEHLVQFLQADQSNAPADHGERLRLLFSNIIKNTSKESLYWHLKMTMLLTIARREGCSFIFMGDSSTLQAIKMISMTSQGRGYSIPFDVGVENDTSFKDLVILRPMKDMLAKEIAYYNTIVGLNKYVVAPTNWATKMPAKSSIERLTEDFIVSLDKDFPSTVSTISRTASKLTPSKNLDLQRTCAICSLPFQAGIAEWRHRITVSKMDPDLENASNSAANKSCDSADACCGGGSCGGKDEPIIDMNLCLCYSCQVDLKDYRKEAVELLPPFVAKNAYNQQRDEGLRKQIEEFLLSDDEA